MGDRKPWAMLAAVALLATACNDSTPPPTLATATTAPTTVASSVTTPPTTAPPTTTTSTTSTSTTQSPDARFAEIERMAQEAFVGRMRALYDKDPSALMRWVGSQRIFDESIEAMDLVVFIQAPSADNVDVSLLEVLLDRDDCVVTRVAIDSSAVLEGAALSSTTVSVWWPRDSALQLAAIWVDGTPDTVWQEDCDLTSREINP